MKHLIASAAAVAAMTVAVPAIAQDANPFTGAYVGLQVGVAQVDTLHTDVDDWYYYAQDAKSSDANVSFGLKAGYDFSVKGPVIAGVLAEAQFAKVDSVKEYSRDADDLAYEIGSKQSVLGSLRAKLGLVSGNLAVYGTAGIAFSNADQRYLETDGCCGENFEGKGNRTGYVLGLGADYAVSANSSIGFDLSRYNFGSRTHELLESDGFATEYFWDVKDRVDAATVNYTLRF